MKSSQSAFTGHARVAVFSLLGVLLVSVSAAFLLGLRSKDTDVFKWLEVVGVFCGAGATFATVIELRDQRRAAQSPVVSVRSLHHKTKPQADRSSIELRNVGGGPMLLLRLTRLRSDGDGDSLWEDGAVALGPLMPGETHVVPVDPRHEFGRGTTAKYRFTLSFRGVDGSEHEDTWDLLSDGSLCAIVSVRQLTAFDLTARRARVASALAARQSELSSLGYQCEYLGAPPIETLKLTPLDVTPDEAPRTERLLEFELTVETALDQLLAELRAERSAQQVKRKRGYSPKDWRAALTEQGIQHPPTGDA